VSQGKPDIKAIKKKDGKLSSEAERKEAEANAKKGTENWAPFIFQLTV